MTAAHTPSATLVALHQISAGYEHKLVLHDITCAIHRGDILHIAGANGEGKTTLLRVIAGLTPPVAGKRTQAHGLIMGYLPQHRHIDREFPMTVFEVVESGLHCRKSLFQPFSNHLKSQVETLLNQFGIDHLAQTPISELSGGQWQRTLIARALAGNPDLLLLDEPDTHLDENGKELLHNLLDKEAEKRTIVLVSHEPVFLPHHPRLRKWHIQQGELRISP